MIDPVDNQVVIRLARSFLRLISFECCDVRGVPHARLNFGYAFEVVACSDGAT